MCDLFETNRLVTSAHSGVTEYQWLSSFTSRRYHPCASAVIYVLALRCLILIHIVRRGGVVALTRVLLN